MAYAIGVAKPVSLFVDTFELGDPDRQIEELLRTHLISPQSDHSQPGSGASYLPAGGSVWAFWATDLDLPWERLDKVKELRVSFVRVGVC